MAIVFVIGGVPVEGREIGKMEVKHNEASAIARKKIAGGLSLLEDVGENDETLTISGRLVPFEDFSSRGFLNALRDMRKSRAPQMVVRGNGEVLGWFVVEALEDKHARIHASGVGRIIEFSAKLVAAPPPTGGMKGGQFKRSLVPDFLVRWLGI